MKSRFKTLLLIAILTFLGTDVRANTELEDVQPFSSMHARFLSFVETLPTIRIGITNGGQMGNQAAGLLIYRRLRELGYLGKIEIIYDDSVDEKLHQMMPDIFNLRTGEYSSEFHKIRTVCFSKFQASPEKYGPVTLAILGARDNLRGGFGNPTGDFTPDALRAQIFLQLQPAHWDGGYRRIIDGNQAISLERFFDLGIPRTLHQPFIMDIDYIYAQAPGGANSLELSENMARLAHLFKTADIAPVYGHGVELGRPLLQYLVGIRGAFLRNSHIFQGGVVVPVFNDMRFSMETIRRLIEAYPDLVGKIHMTSISDSSLRHRGEHLKPGEILLVEVGPVPQKIFEMVYIHSTVPPLVKGRNSIDLMRSIGRPYLTTASHEPYPFPLSSYIWPAPGARLLAESAQRILWSPPNSSGYISQDDLLKTQNILGRFIERAMDSDSRLNSLFSHFQRTGEDLRKDLLVRGLLATKKHLDQKAARAARAQGWDQCFIYLQNLRRVLEGA